MAYSTSSPPQLTQPRMGGTGPNQWTYSSTHTSTAAAAAGFFTNGQALGMKVDDLLFGVEAGTAHYVARVSAVSSTGATIASGTLTSTT